MSNLISIACVVTGFTFGDVKTQAHVVTARQAVDKLRYMTDELEKLIKDEPDVSPAEQELLDASNKAIEDAHKAGNSNVKALLTSESTALRQRALELPEEQRGLLHKEAVIETRRLELLGMLNEPKEAVRA